MKCQCLSSGKIIKKKIIMLSADFFFFASLLSIKIRVYVDINILTCAVSFCIAAVILNFVRLFEYPIFNDKTVSCFISSCKDENIVCKLSL